MDFPKQWKGRMAELECIAVPRTQQQVQRQEETNQNQNIYKSASPSKHLGTERCLKLCESVFEMQFGLQRKHQTMYLF